MIKNDYKSKLEELIGKHQSIASDALRRLLNELSHGNKKVERHIQNSDYLKSKIIVEKDQARIRAAQLKNHVSKNVITPLKNAPELKHRAAIIYTQLCGYNKSNSSLSSSQLEEKLKRITDALDYPSISEDSPNKEGYEDDYKTASLVFTPSRKSSKDTLVFTVAILGIDLTFLGHYLESFKPEDNARKKKNGFLYASIAIFLTLSLAGAWWWVSIDQKPKRLFYEVSSSMLLASTKIPIDERGQPRDSISLEVVQTKFDEFVVKGDTIPLNGLWLRLMISNYSSQTNLYPDGLFYIPVLQEQLFGKVDTHKLSYANDAELILFLPQKLNRIFEWQITNDSDTYFIPPRTRMFMFFKLAKDRFNKQGKYTFRLCLEVFDENRNSLEATSDNIKLVIN